MSQTHVASHCANYKRTTLSLLSFCNSSVTDICPTCCGSSPTAFSVDVVALNSWYGNYSDISWNFRGKSQIV